MQADAVILFVVPQGLVQEAQWSLGIKLYCIVERQMCRKLADEALLLMLVSHNQQCIKMMHDKKLLTRKDAWIYFVLLETKLLKLDGHVLLPILGVCLDTIQSFCELPKHICMLFKLRWWLYKHKLFSGYGCL